MLSTTSREQPPSHPSTEQDIHEWMKSCCRPSDAAYQQWLSGALTHEVAFSVVLNAVFGRGRFRSWHQKPPDLGDPSFHWSEVDDAEQLVESELTEEEVFQCQDPLDRLLDPSGEQAAGEIFRERYRSARSQFTGLMNAKDKTKARYRALNLVTVWLGMELDMDESRIQAQKIAMKLFQHVKQRLGDRNAVKSKGRVGIVKEAVATKFEGESCLHNTVLEELYVFLIVDEIFVDLRVKTTEPYEAGDVLLPIWASIDARDDCWWHNSGQPAIENAVPWTGRGSLAKVTLLLHALTVSLAKANDPSRSGGSSCSYGYIELWADAMNHVASHPLALDASVISLEALSEFLRVDGDVYESQISDVEKYILPNLRSVRDGNKKLDGDKKPSSTEEKLQELFELAEYRANQANSSRANAYKILSHAASKPLHCVSDPGAYVERCLKFLERWIKERVNFDEDGPCYAVQRVSLSGRHSQEHLLRVALGFPAMKILDLEDCCNLDETILNAMAGCCPDLKFVLLFGTSIPETSPVVSKLQKRGCVVDFSGERCRCCGYHDAKRLRIK